MAMLSSSFHLQIKKIAVLVDAQGAMNGGLMALTLSRRFTPHRSKAHVQGETKELDPFVWQLVLKQVQHFADWAALRSTCKALSQVHLLKDDEAMRAEQRIVPHLSEAKALQRITKDHKRIALIGSNSWPSTTWFWHLWSLHFEPEDRVEFTLDGSPRTGRRWLSPNHVGTFECAKFLLFISRGECEEVRAMWSTLDIIVLGQLDMARDLIPIWLRVFYEHHLNASLLQKGHLMLIKGENGFQYATIH
jgi:hypothetical protein